MLQRFLLLVLLLADVHSYVVAKAVGFGNVLDRKAVTDGIEDGSAQCISCSLFKRGNTTISTTHSKRRIVNVVCI